MKTVKAIKRKIRQRSLFVITSSIIMSLISSITFYTIFLLFPGPIVKTGIVAPMQLIIFWLLSMFIPLISIVYKYPLLGKKFFDSILTNEFSSSDAKTALELDKQKGYPDSLREKGTLSSYLSEEFSNKVSNSISDKDKSAFSFIFTNKIRIIIFSVISIIAVLLTINRVSFLSDIITALRTGLPTQLISIGPVIKFDKIEARIIPPAYLEAKKYNTVNLKSSNNIRVLEGSKVVINGKLESIKNGSLFFSTKKGLEYFPINIKKNDNFEVSFLAPSKGAFALEFDRKAGEKQVTEKSRVYRIETFPDKPPEIRIFAPEKNHKIIYGLSFGISFAASDDYGILEISLLHREAGSEDEYYKELITRFPRESKKSYSTTYVWNPILREGEKLQQLVYHPDIEKVEYLIEVRDINMFSSKGVTRSDLRYVSFTNLISQFANAINIIKELIKDGEDLLIDLNNKFKIKSYRDKLESAIKTFRNELRETMPRSSIIRESQKIYNTLSRRTSQDTEEQLKSYIEFLKRYLLLMDFLMQSESFDIRSGALDNVETEFKNGEFDSTFKKFSSIIESLGKEVMDELKKIQDLIKKGETAKAKEKMAKLLEKIKEQMSSDLKNSRTMNMQMAKETMEKLDQIMSGAKERIKEQKKNIVKTKKRMTKSCMLGQEKINKKLESLSMDASKLSSEYPLVLNNLSAYARMASNNGQRSYKEIKSKKFPEAIKSEERVVQNLESLLKESQRQKQQIQQMMKDNFNMLKPSGRRNWFVYIPKEAVYTVPIKYKDKIINMSKKRGKNTKEKEAFWRDVLE